MIEEEQVKDFSNETIAKYLEDYIKNQDMSGTFPNFVIEAVKRLRGNCYKSKKYVKVGKTKYQYVSSFVDKEKKFLVYKTWNKNTRLWHYVIWMDCEDFH